MHLPFCIPLFVPVYSSSSKPGDIDFIDDIKHKNKLSCFRGKRLLAALVWILSAIVFLLVVLFDSSQLQAFKQHLLQDPIVSLTETRQQAHTHNQDFVSIPSHCRSVNLFVDPATNSKRVNKPAPMISIIYITKRPGGYDLLLNSLAQQARPSTHQLPLHIWSSLAGHRESNADNKKRNNNDNNQNYFDEDGDVDDNDAEISRTSTKFHPHQNSNNNNNNTSATFSWDMVYELICVDELAWARAAKVHAFAEELGVNLVAVVPSKPKSPQHRNTAFGIYNAINTGVLLARGAVVTFVMDLSWLPPTYLQRTVEFYLNPKRSKSFLSYPELFYSLARDQFPAKHEFENHRALTIFLHNQTVPFSKEPHEFHVNSGRPEDMIRDIRDGKVLDFEKQPRWEVTGGFKFWELSFATCPFSVLQALNGVEEELDVGDDCHEANIQLRSEFLGYDLWIDGRSMVENLYHKGAFQPHGELWNRYAKDSIQDIVILRMPGEIAREERGVQSRYNNFNISLWRKWQCAALV